jgi:hypothetical protein
LIAVQHSTTFLDESNSFINAHQGDAFILNQ